jgi:hypothetical protein
VPGDERVSEDEPREEVPLIGPFREVLERRIRREGEPDGHGDRPGEGHQARHTVEGSLDAVGWRR